MKGRAHEASLAWGGERRSGGCLASRCRKARILAAGLKAGPKRPVGRGQRVRGPSPHWSYPVVWPPVLSQGIGLDLAGTCLGGGTPLVAAGEMIGAEQRRSRMVDGAATRRPPAHVPRCRGAGTQIAGRVLAERPISDYPTGVRRAPATPSSLIKRRGGPQGPTGNEKTRSGNRLRERKGVSAETRIATPQPYGRRALALPSGRR
jgi:hypothetical protein